MGFNDSGCVRWKEWLLWTGVVLWSLFDGGGNLVVLFPKPLDFVLEMLMC